MESPNSKFGVIFLISLVILESVHGQCYVSKKNHNLNPQTIGRTESFVDLVNKSTVIVDKTLFIKRFISSDYKVELITTPRRWGKSVNLDMLRTFLNIEVDKEYKVVTPNETQAHKLFVEGVTEKGKIEKFQISRDTDFVNKYLGQHPTIYLTFKNVTGNSFTEVMKQIGLAVRDAYLRFEYMRDVLTINKNDNSTHLSVRIKVDADLFVYKTHLGEEEEGPMNGELLTSMFFLSRVLNEHFDQPVFILLDDYDTPVNHILHSKDFSKSDLHKTIDFLHHFMACTFIKNDNLNRGLITGVMRTKKWDHASLKDIKQYSFLDSTYAAYFGFTQTEVDDLLDIFDVTSSSRKAAKSWYDGYALDPNSDLELYNTWSILEFFKARQIEKFWTDPGDMKYITPIFKTETVKPVLHDLINNTCLYIDVNKIQFTVEDFFLLKELPDGPPKKPEVAREIFSRYIFANGYLGVDRNNSNKHTHCFKAANREAIEDILNKMK